MAYNQNTDAENLGSTQSDGMETVSAVPDVDEEAGAGDLEYSARSRSSGVGAGLLVRRTQPDVSRASASASTAHTGSRFACRFRIYVHPF